MQKQTNRFFNPYFHIPFIIWVLFGGVALLMFDNSQLFSFFNGHHTPVSDILMYFITFLGDGLFSTILLLSLFAFPSLRNRWYFFTALLTNAIPTIIIQVIKSSANAARPLKFFNNAEWIHIQPDWPRYMERSFPSGHATSAFCLFCFISLLLPSKYRAWGFALFTLGLLVAYSRMYLAAHFFLDVYVGSIIATVFTTLIFAFMDKRRNAKLSVLPG